MEKLVFHKIHRYSIYNQDFDSLDETNGTIEFRKKNTSGGIAVIYAPNGSGKSSFTEVLKSETSSNDLDFKAVDEKGRNINPLICPRFK